MSVTLPVVTLRIFSGGAGTGKTTALIDAARGAAETYGRDAVILTAPRASAARRLRTLMLRDSGERNHEDARAIGTTLETLALDVIRDAGLASGLALDPAIVDDDVAERIFADIAEPLYALEWDEFVSDEIDPEISGLRAPDRFARAALTLVRKLRDAKIDPDAFLDRALRGAAAFYGNPPNLADPRLLAATRDEYRDSLIVDAAELERQRRRELDLAKILTRLYRSYNDALVTAGCLLPDDALIEAERLLRNGPERARSLRARYRAAFIDDAQDLASSALRFLQAIFGEALAGVTFAGDPDQATRTFAGARANQIFGLDGETVRFETQYRFGGAIAAAAARALERPWHGTRGDPNTVRFRRGKLVEDEARFVADEIATRIAGGTDPSHIAVIARSLRSTPPFEEALLAANVDVTHDGAFDLFVRHEVRDAVALLWSVVDPFEHAQLLRVLQMRPLGFDDETLATLCGEPSDPQALLFELPPDELQAPKRWDRRRDLRLATNVIRGDRDVDLPAVARERLQAFRAVRERWTAILQHASLGAAARTILVESGVERRGPQENGARHRRRLGLVRELIARIERYGARDPRRTLESFLRTAARTSETLPQSSTRNSDHGAVVIGDVDALKGETFDHVFVIDVRAGAFTPYYAPDAFLFSPRWGMIPKDNVGEARAARTAKFTWYQHDAKLRDHFAREGRRALACAISRARSSVTITASGKATRGVAAPELLAELQSAALAAIDTSGRPAVGGAPPLADLADVPASLRPSGVAEAAKTLALVPIDELQALRCPRCSLRRPAVLASVAPERLLRLVEGAGGRIEGAFNVTVRWAGALVYGVLPGIVVDGHRRFLIVDETLRAAPSLVVALASLACDDGALDGTGVYTASSTGEVTGPHAIERPGGFACGDCGEFFEPPAR